MLMRLLKGGQPKPGEELLGSSGFNIEALGANYAGGSGHGMPSADRSQRWQSSSSKSRSQTPKRQGQLGRDSGGSVSRVPADVDMSVAYEDVDENLLLPNSPR